MKKKLIAIIIITILAILSGIFIIPKLIFGNINHKELKEDMKSIKEYQKITNAVKQNTPYGSLDIYKGKGYKVKVYRGGEVVDYIITVKNKEIWRFSKFYPETTR